MKYIKLFENDLNPPVLPTYWLVPTDDRFSDSLKKIGISDKFTEFLKYKEILEPYIYISYTPGYGLVKDGWGMNPYKNGHGNSLYIEYKYIFGGNLNIPYYELKAMKYNI
jgi:hypothetical protein